MYLVCFLIGFIIGCVCGILIFKNKNKVGILRVDQSDPEETYLFMELDSEKRLDKIKSLRNVVLDVNVKNYISQ